MANPLSPIRERTQIVKMTPSLPPARPGSTAPAPEKDPAAARARTCLSTAARRGSFTAALLSVLLLSSCTYLKDRGVDFLDQFRAVAGASTGAGIRFSNFGLWNTGLLFGINTQDTSFGVKYGRPIVFSATTTNAEFEADPSWLLFTTTLENCNFAGGSYKLARKSLRHGRLQEPLEPQLALGP